ncbi:hypothetical protein BDN67DRAFT_1003980 [Paxillus ammoniavirescens]|nr:hypothetical protein BDN67DRAFT_1003980 [Paxillus ammoniavirescens]
MSSLDAVLDGLQLLDYMSVAGAAAVCYDYVLTFSREVDLIWGRSWSAMSILFIVARYLGLALAIGNGLCVAMNQVLVWGMFMYLLVSKAIMALRVAVMFDDPKRTIYILSFLYLLVVIEGFIMVFLLTGPHSGFIVSNITLADDTICTSQSGRGIMFAVYGGIPATLFDVLMLALSLYRFVIHSIETRKMLGRTKASVYMRLLFEHSVLYFVLNAPAKGLADGMVGSSSIVYITLATVYASTVPYVIFPRLVLGFKGHRWESSALYVASTPPQHSPPHSPPPLSGGPRGEDYEITDLNSPGPSRLLRST